MVCMLGLLLLSVTDLGHLICERMYIYSYGETYSITGMLCALELYVHICK